MLAPVGVWIDTPANKPVDFAGDMRPRSEFLNWAQIKEVAASGLVEIVALTDASHQGVLANPQGNLQPAAATRRYDASTGVMKARLISRPACVRMLVAISSKIRAATGYSPRVWVWPYGTADGTALKVIESQGYKLALTLDDGIDSIDQLMNSPRMLVSADPDGSHYAGSIVSVQNRAAMRVVQVDLDNATTRTRSSRKPTSASWSSASPTWAPIPCSCKRLPIRRETAWCILCTSPTAIWPMRADLFDRVALATAHPGRVKGVCLDAGAEFCPG